MAQAQDEVRRIGQSLAQQYPGTNRGFAVDIAAAQQQVTGRIREAMLLLLGTVGFVLLMACANVANLLLARAAARAARDLDSVRARRLPLPPAAATVDRGPGIGRCRRSRRSGCLRGRSADAHRRPRPSRCAWATRPSMAARWPSPGPPSCSAPSSPVCRPLGAWCVRISSTALREAGRNLTAGSIACVRAWSSCRWPSRCFCWWGPACSFAASSGCSPWTPASRRATSSPFRPRFRHPAQPRGSCGTLSDQFHDQLVCHARSPNAAAVSRLPLMGSNLGAWLYAEGKIAPGEPGHDVEYRVATPNYFATMGIPLRAGRFFDEHDDANPGTVVLINDTAARNVLARRGSRRQADQAAAVRPRFPLDHRRRRGWRMCITWAWTAIRGRRCIGRMCSTRCSLRSW